MNLPNLSKDQLEHIDDIKARFPDIPTRTELREYFLSKAKIRSDFYFKEIQLYLKACKLQEIEGITKILAREINMNPTIEDVIRLCKKHGKMKVNFWYRNVYARLKKDYPHFWEKESRKQMNFLLPQTENAMFEGLCQSLGKSRSETQALIIRALYLAAYRNQLSLVEIFSTVNKLSLEEVRVLKNSLTLNLKNL